MPRRIDRPHAAAAATTIACIAALLWLVWPLLAGGSPAGHDGPAHLTYTYLFDEAFAQGQRPVRWVESLQPGQGQPLFNFYQPGFYYAVQAIHTVVPSLAVSLNATVATLWVLGAIGIAGWLRPLGRLPALAGAMLFAFAPYLFLDVYVRAAYTELCALALAPHILWAIDRTRRGPTAIALPCAALVGGAMLVAHLPTTMLCAPLFVLVAFGPTGAPAIGGRAHAGLVLAGALAGGLAAFYAWPAFAEMPRIRMQALTSGYFDYRAHFVEPWQWWRSTWGHGPSVEGPGDGMSFALGGIQWAALVAAVVVLAVPRLRRGGTRRETLALSLWLLAAAAALGMTSTWAARVWEAVPPLAFVQFPWRWLMVVAVSVSAAGALLVARIRNVRLQAALVVGAALLLVGTSAERRTPARIVTAAQLPIDSPDLRAHPGARRWAFVEAGYFPRTAGPVDAELASRWLVSPAVASVSPRVLTHDTVRLVVEMRASGPFTIASYDFPGWRAWIDGAPALVTTQPGTGYLELHVPAGRHEVEARFTDTVVRGRANRISLASAILAAGWLAAGAVHAWRRTRARLPVLSARAS